MFQKVKTKFIICDENPNVELVEFEIMIPFCDGSYDSRIDCRTCDTDYVIKRDVVNILYGRNRKLLRHILMIDRKFIPGIDRYLSHEEILSICGRMEV